MPAVNTIITAIVASLAIGAQAGPCRPHRPLGSMIQSQAATTVYVQPTVETSAAYSDAVSKSESEASLSTTVYAQPSTETSAAYSDAVSESETVASLSTTTQVTSSEKTETTTSGRPAGESTSAVSDSLNTETAINPTTAAQETTSSLPSTKQEAISTFHTTISVPSTTSQAEDVPSTTSTEPQNTVAPTATSSEPATTSQASTTASEVSTSSCANKSSLTCGKTGFFANADNMLLYILPNHDLEACKAGCEANEECKAIGINTSDQCELYKTSVSALGFEARDPWYFSVYDICCFEDEQ
ncbi:unnamed protein product [Fusarium graminearum]|nr:unnamed protein product [Fusarium graminearum]